MLGFDDGHTNDAIKGLDEDEKATPLKIVGRNDFNGLLCKDIRNLMVSKDFTERNFALSAYADTTGRSLPMYHLTRDGFMILVMGYTGAKAMALKEAYIAEFNHMEAELANRASIALPDFTDPAAKFH